MLAGDLSAVQVGIFRSVIAAFAAIPFLLIGRARFPNRSQIKRMLLTSTGIVYGFPILTALGMQYVPVSHGGVVLAALPLSTAIFGTLITGTRPSRAFWAISSLGFLVVMSYTVLKSNVSEIYVGDLALLGAVALAGFGYAQGGALSKELPGWQVMCWTLVISLPVLLPASLWLFDSHTIARLPAAGSPLCCSWHWSTRCWASFPGTAPSHSAASSASANCSCCNRSSPSVSRSG
ncbi:DMT family transporter [Pseudomonas sp. PCH446]